MDEEDFRGADHVDDQRLGPERFHELARMENRHEYQFHCGGKARPMSARDEGADEEKHQYVGRYVKDGTCRADPEHETADGGGVPLWRLAEEIHVNVVPRDGDAGNVVDEVQHQNVNGQHRQEGQERRGRKHGEHIAEV